MKFEKFWLQNIILQPNYNQVYFRQGKPQPSLLALDQEKNVAEFVDNVDSVQ